MKKQFTSFLIQQDNFQKNILFYFFFLMSTDLPFIFLCYGKHSMSILLKKHYQRMIAQIGVTLWGSKPHHSILY